MVVDLISAGLSIYGGIRGAQAQRRAQADARRQALQQRALIKETTNQAVSDIQAGAQPLFAQAVGLERASRFRDPMVEQGLVAGLRQQAGAQATDARQVGGGDRRGAVIAQLLRGQGLLAAESQRLQRFQQLSQMAAQVRSQGAQVLGQAAQARMQGAATLAGVNVPTFQTDPTAVGLTALGQGLSALSKAGAFDPDPVSKADVLAGNAAVVDTPMSAHPDSIQGKLAQQGLGDFADTQNIIPEGLEYGMPRSLDTSRPIPQQTEGLFSGFSGDIIPLPPPRVPSDFGTSVPVPPIGFGSQASPSMNPGGYEFSMPAQTHLESLRGRFNEIKSKYTFSPAINQDFMRQNISGFVDEMDARRSLTTPLSLSRSLMQIR